ncbi:hypothetical protein BT246_68140 (plasmid) [Bacillus thuringiensis]|uniref:SWIM-type domain-containing protein n=1 Tax=Bacillus thuringiensis TaxID=1428 RepID=A0A9W3SJN9_BACTU|nr:hypothetical protein [Bacillus thuringiensis]ANS52105.1 hypothetical protein BT246_68140 [Bacillus thuringiensis]
MSNLQNLTKEKIHQSFSSAAYTRGYAYYRQGRVIDLNYDDTQSVWHGRVSGRDIYHVTVNVHSDSFDASCDCLAYNRFLECKHGVAVLFALCGDEVKESFFVSTIPARNKQIYRPTEQFINLFRTHQTITQARDPEQKHLLRVEFTCKSYRESPLSRRSGNMLLRIEMKVGLDRMYVVRNIKEFLKNMKAHHTHEFTKKFTYDSTDVWKRIFVASNAMSSNFYP